MVLRKRTHGILYDSSINRVRVVSLQIDNSCKYLRESFICSVVFIKIPKFSFCIIYNDTKANIYVNFLMSSLYSYNTATRNHSKTISNIRTDAAVVSSLIADFHILYRMFIYTHLFHATLIIIIILYEHMYTYIFPPKV